ncbi:MAG: arsenate reductase family protein [Vampirovibrionales bacterium]
MMMMASVPTSVALYWLPYCSTCQKAKAYLESKGLTITLTHDVKAQPLPLATIVQLAEAVGGAEALFSKRAMKYRSLGLHEQELSPEALLNHMANEYTFIKRPMMVFDTGKTLCGFSTKAIDTLLTAG